MTDTPPDIDSPSPESPQERAARAAEAMRAAEAAGARAAEAARARRAAGPQGPGPQEPGPQGSGQHGSGQQGPGQQGPERQGPARPQAAASAALPADAREGRAALDELFASLGVPAGLAARTAARLGPGAAARLREDPWRLLSVPGVQPAQADHFARALLGPDARPDDPRRGGALVLHLLTEAARRGHTVTPLADVVSALERARVADTRAAVEAALDGGEVVTLTEEPEFDEESFDEDAEPPEPEETLGPARWALAEEAAAEGFQRLTLTAAPLLDDDAVKELRAGLPEDRSLALTAALRTGVSVLRAAPDALAEVAAGIAAAAASRGLRAAVAAPTERA
ncbi:helix-hairpin-helix domain-containing protein, partial [Spirillospora sp. NPDC046719]